MDCSLPASSVHGILQARVLEWGVIAYSGLPVITNSRSSPKPTSIELVMPFNYLSSSVIPFSSCPQSFPESGSFQMSQLFSSGCQSIGVSASVSVQAILLDNSLAIINQILLHSYPQKQGPWSTIVYLNHRYELFQQPRCQKLNLYAAAPD